MTGSPEANALPDCSDAQPDNERTRGRVREREDDRAEHEPERHAQARERVDDDVAPAFSHVWGWHGSPQDAAPPRQLLRPR
jgi:hypothetical protein